MDMEYVIQKLLENVIKRSLFPRTTISVFVQVICDDGAISFIISYESIINQYLLSTIINSVMLSLADSGIPITVNFASVCLLLSLSGEILPDPCKEEEELNVKSSFHFYDRMLELQPLYILKKVIY